MSDSDKQYETNTPPGTKVAKFSNKAELVRFTGKSNIENTANIRKKINLAKDDRLTEEDELDRTQKMSNETKYDIDMLNKVWNDRDKAK